MSEALKLTQLSTSEIKLDDCGEFLMNSFKDNSIIIVGCNDICVLELMNCTPSPNNTFPFKQTYAKISKNLPLKDLVEYVNLANIYEKSNVQESQELALEPIYVAHCAVESPKPRIIHVDRVPISQQQQRQLKLYTTLTSFGACDLMQRDPITKAYCCMDTNLSIILMKDIFPIKKSPNDITTFSDLRDFINQYWITYFCWQKHSQGNDNEIILYVGTAAGYIIALKYDIKKQNFHEYFHQEVTKTRIVYLYNFDHFLIIGDIQGTIQLMKIYHETRNLKLCQNLWNHPDRITCHKAVITSIPQKKLYLVSFFKGVHLFVNYVNNDGIQLSKAKLYINGIKITGLEVLSGSEFIVTTITGNIILIKIHIHANTNEVKLVDENIEHDLDLKNYQILGICTTKNRYLWSILLYRNKEYTHYSKYNNNSAFVSVCKLNNINFPMELDKLIVYKMEHIMDLLIAIVLDMSKDNPNDVNQYDKIWDLEQLITTKSETTLLESNNLLLQKLQIKFIILQNQAKQQTFKYKICKRQTVMALEFLETVIQLIHIFNRLKYLYQFSEEQKDLSSFQQLSVACMLDKWNLLIAKLKASKTDENYLNDCIDTILPVLIHEEIINCPWDITKLQFPPEKCNICNETLEINEFRMCKQMHEIKRCSISYIQLPLFHTRFCPQCFAVAVADDKNFNLKELFPKNEAITCTFCRCSLIQDKL